jgi:hypothetical protein
LFLRIVVFDLTYLPLKASFDSGGAKKFETRCCTFWVASSACYRRSDSSIIYVFGDALGFLMGEGIFGISYDIRFVSDRFNGFTYPVIICFAR